MACLAKNQNVLVIHIPSTLHCTTTNATLYDVVAKIGDVSWQVSHRYRDFDELHQKLVAAHALQKDLLPSKKLLGNRDPAFIEKRRQELEKYLRTVTLFYKVLPDELAEFFNMQAYEILYLLRALAVRFYDEGDGILQDNKQMIFTPLELHAISERTKLALPPLETSDKRQDFSHVLDFCSRLLHLSVWGSTSTVLNSDIIPNNLPFDLCAFKSVTRLDVKHCNAEKFTDVQTARSTVRLLSVNHCNLKHLVDFLLCDTVHHDVTSHNGATEGQSWTAVETANFSHNLLCDMSESLLLLPNVEILDLSYNCLESVSNMTCLTHLQSLNISANNIKILEPLHTKLGNVVSLDLSQNKLSTLTAFAKLYSLATLNVSSNEIERVEDVAPVGRLPCLESLSLTGNPVASVVDFRIKVLQLFCNRASELYLDNEKPSQKEMDKVAVLHALQLAKEGRISQSLSDFVPNA